MGGGASCMRENRGVTVIDSKSLIESKIVVDDKLADSLAASLAISDNVVIGNSQAAGATLNGDSDSNNIGNIEITKDKSNNNVNVDAVEKDKEEVKPSSNEIQIQSDTNAKEEEKEEKEPVKTNESEEKQNADNLEKQKEKEQDSLQEQQTKDAVENTVTKMDENDGNQREPVTKNEEEEEIKEEEKRKKQEEEEKEKEKEKEKESQAREEKLKELLVSTETMYEDLLKKMNELKLSDEEERELRIKLYILQRNIEKDDEKLKKMDKQQQESLRTEIIRLNNERIESLILLLEGIKENKIVETRLERRNRIFSLLEDTKKNISEILQNTHYLQSENDLLRAIQAEKEDNSQSMVLEEQAKEKMKTVELTKKWSHDLENLSSELEFDVNSSVGVLQPQMEEAVLFFTDFSVKMKSKYSEITCNKPASRTVSRTSQVNTDNNTIIDVNNATNSPSSASQSIKKEIVGNERSNTSNSNRSNSRASNGGGVSSGSRRNSLMLKPSSSSGGLTLPPAILRVEQGDLVKLSSKDEIFKNSMENNINPSYSSASLTNENQVQSSNTTSSKENNIEKVENSETTQATENNNKETVKGKSMPLLFVAAENETERERESKNKLEALEHDIEAIESSDAVVEKALIHISRHKQSLQDELDVIDKLWIVTYDDIFETNGDAIQSKIDDFVTCYETIRFCNHKYAQFFSLLSESRQEIDAMKGKREILLLESFPKISKSLNFEYERAVAEIRIVEETWKLKGNLNDIEKKSETLSGKENDGDENQKMEKLIEFQKEKESLEFFVSYEKSLKESIMRFKKLKMRVEESNRKNQNAIALCGIYSPSLATFHGFIKARISEIQARRKLLIAKGIIATQSNNNNNNNNNNKNDNAASSATHSYEKSNLKNHPILLNSTISE